MITLESLEIENYRNIRKTGLYYLKDLNIFIGPNNCGKTNILKTIQLITKLNVKNGLTYRCQACQTIKNVCETTHNKEISFEICGGHYLSNKNEAFLRTDNFNLKYTFSKTYLSDTLKMIRPDATLDAFGTALAGTLLHSNLPEPQKTSAIKHLDTLGLVPKVYPTNPPPPDMILKQYDEGNIELAHISVISIKKIAEEIRNKTITIDDTRLQRYKETTITEYIRNKNLSGTEITRLLEFLKEIVDPRVRDYKQNSLEIVKEDGFVTLIEEQGSGVRSLICLASDMLSSGNGSIILIDEPELGLNSAAKQAFLKFLLEESETKQIFITTHDPAFVNPIILPSEGVAIYLYSPLYDKQTNPYPDEPNFVKLNLTENPHTFGGYLPHSESLKPVHVYVEGHKDVKNLQTLMGDYFRQYRREEVDRFGIYPLGGGFWKHLLYTIPSSPYHSMVILDSDKVNEAEKVCKDYDSKKFISPKFTFCKTMKDIEGSLTVVADTVPVYCIDKGNVEEIKTIEEANLKEILELLIRVSTK